MKNSKLFHIYSSILSNKQTSNNLWAYYYHFLVIFSSKIKTPNTFTNIAPKYAFGAKNIGPLPFAFWSHFEGRARIMPPVQDGPIAKIYATLVKQVINIFHWHRESHIDRRLKRDDLRTGFEESEWKM